MKAQCQCGSVTLEVKHNHEVHACHCGKCRRRTGGASFTLTAEEQPQISGEEYIGRYRSSDWGERTFCKQCGNDLYFHLLPSTVLPPVRRHPENDRTRISGVGWRGRIGSLRSVADVA